MAVPSALDPWRCLKAVLGASRRCWWPLVAWWGGGSIVGAGLVVVNEFVEVPPALEGWTLLLLLGALLVLGIVWRVGLARAVLAALEPGGAARRRTSGVRRFLVVGATYASLGLILMAVSAPFVVGLAVLDASSEREPVLTFVLLALWATTLLHVGLGLSLAPFAAAVEEAGPLALLAHTWRLARGRRLALALFWLATLVFALAGLLAFGLGILATGALLHLMPTEAWLRLSSSASAGEERAEP